MNGTNTQNWLYVAMACRVGTHNEYLECGITNRKSIPQKKHTLKCLVSKKRGMNFVFKMFEIVWNKRQSWIFAVSIHTQKDETQDSFSRPTES